MRKPEWSIDLIRVILGFEPLEYCTQARAQARASAKRKRANLLKEENAHGCATSQ